RYIPWSRIHQGSRELVRESGTGPQGPCIYTASVGSAGYKCITRSSEGESATLLGKIRRRKMAIDFQFHRFTFPSDRGHAQSLEHTFVFPTNIIGSKAQPVINGFNIGFSSSDHHLFRQQIDTSVTRILNNTVTVICNFALRDSSGFFDDAYDGTVDVVL